MLKTPSADIVQKIYISVLTAAAAVEVLQVATQISNFKIYDNDTNLNSSSSSSSLQPGKRFPIWKHHPGSRHDPLLCMRVG